MSATLVCAAQRFHRRARRDGILSKDQAAIYRFQYAAEYLSNTTEPAISLSFPKREAPFESSILFPFFFGLLAEGDD